VKNTEPTLPPLLVFWTNEISIISIIKLVGEEHRPGMGFSCPLEAEPLDIVLDVFYIFRFFRNGVGVIKVEVGFAPRI
jgi:hypothetical protein